MTDINSQATVVTGIKPTGRPHLGNYLGSIRPALELAHTQKAFYFIADAHALTTIKNATQLNDLVCQVAATWIALGLDPKKITFYRQSAVPEIFAVAWILTNVTPKGLLNRAHAYKAAIERNRSAGRNDDSGINAGLYNYPVLMAADILSLDADMVPVGRDQQQHIEMTRDIAAGFNRNFGDVLTVPRMIVREPVDTVCGLDGLKMSKSYSNTIPVLSEPKELLRLIMRILTDSGRPEEPKDPDQCNVFALYRQFAPVRDVARMKNRYLEGGVSYKEIKEELYEILVNRFSSPRSRYAELMADQAGLKGILDEGGENARRRARRTLSRVRTAVGFEGPPKGAYPLKKAFANANR